MYAKGIMRFSIAIYSASKNENRPLALRFIALVYLLFSPRNENFVGPIPVNSLK